jgi:hypothetical protein
LKRQSILTVFRMIIIITGWILVCCVWKGSWHYNLPTFYEQHVVESPACRHAGWLANFLIKLLFFTFYLLFTVFGLSVGCVHNLDTWNSTMNYWHHYFQFHALFKGRLILNPIPKFFLLIHTLLIYVHPRAWSSFSMDV